MRGSAAAPQAPAESSTTAATRARAAVLAEIETIRERVWRNKRIKIDSPEWVATLGRLAELRKELKRA